MRSIRVLLAALCLVVVGLEFSQTAEASRRKVIVRNRPHRVRVVVRTGHPIRRTMPLAVVRVPRRAVVVTGAVFLAPVVWAPRVVALPARDVIVYTDSEKLAKDEDWTDFSLNVEERGRRMLLETEGKVQVEFAEVVFENEDVQVVDFGSKSYGPGIRELIDFKDGRKVDHVRMLARARTDEAKVVLHMEK